ncbi:putative UPF0481 protein At3g02645 [Macadamia integrifolia]|uniref:putative UPF0481 protein At3g02645 n=1 Tax=Macadamia integrifolia TaxID=60698 RepID=UPI001C4F3891|nr:putative UPF0481 protein At3g02645 [Macadamia integrifolia]
MIILICCSWYPLLVGKNGWELHSMATDEGLDDRQMNNEEIKKLAKSIEGKLEEISYLQSDYDIYRVPRQLHKLSPEAYTPHSVSIGPLHHKDEHLRTMETHKLRYLKRLLNRQPTKKTLDVYVKGVSKLENKARNCYSDVGFEKDEFVKMMVMDGCFILEFFQTNLKREKDHLRSNTSWFWEIMHDLMKPENQIPLFVLEHLHGLIFDLHEEWAQFNFCYHIYVTFLILFAPGFHAPIINSEELKSLPFPGGGPKHILDLLRYVLVPPSSQWTMEPGGEILSLTCCASNLKSAGVKFRKREYSKSSKTYLFDITFDMDNGVLTIPTIELDDSTELILRNLTAFKQGQNCIEYFTSYAFFMDGLIDAVKDVELLQQKGIIINILGSAEEAVNLFNNICKGLSLRNPIFSSVIKDLENYHNNSWNKRKANLKQNYFNTPWASISVGAAVFLLILTIIQTVCSILQLKP